MIALGSIIQVLSMLMLSLTNRDQYYQVGPNITHRLTDPELLSLGFLGTGGRNRPRTSSTFSAFINYYRSPLQTSEGFGYWNCCLRKFGQFFPDVYLYNRNTL